MDVEVTKEQRGKGTEPPLLSETHVIDGMQATAPASRRFAKELNKAIDEVVIAYATNSLEIVEEYSQKLVNVGRRAANHIEHIEAENKKLLDSGIAAGFIGNGTQIIGDKRYKELVAAEKEFKLFS